MKPDDDGFDGRKVLIVEDSYLASIDLKRRLEGKGAAVVGPVPDLATALAVVSQADALDAAILDINLGEDLVYPVAELLQERRIPFVFSSEGEEVTIPSSQQGTVEVGKPADLHAAGAALFVDEQDFQS
jgi:CheY-like chemotaxis protein